MFRLKGNKVVGAKGDVLAEKVRGIWHTKEPKVLAFIKEQEQPAPKPKAKKKAKPAETELVMERARDDNGHFIADDPETEVNEAWVVKTAKKVLKK